MKTGMCAVTVIQCCDCSSMEAKATRNAEYSGSQRSLSEKHLYGSFNARPNTLVWSLL